MQRIPVVDLTEARRPGSSFVRDLGLGLERFGFVAVVNHGIPTPLLRDAYRLAGETFALPEAVKRRYETPGDGRQRGYTSFGVEHAKDTPLPDLKEFWHVGRTLPPDHPLHLSRDVPPNRFPAEVPAFEPTFKELFGRVEAFADTLLDSVGLYLGLPDGYFRALTRDGNSVLRVIHYPDVAGPPGAVRAAAHEDINLCTLLVDATAPGLEIRSKDGRWIPVQGAADEIVADTGDMVQRITGGAVPSVTHRVVNGDGPGDRMSMPFFVHPRPDAVLRVLDAFRGPGWPTPAPDVTGQAFLEERLREQGLL